MAILRAKEISKMEPKIRREKLKELKMELIKSNVAANKSNAKSKEIKKAIARIITYEKLNKIKGTEKIEKLDEKHDKEKKKLTKSSKDGGERV